MKPVSPSLYVPRCFRVGVGLTSFIFVAILLLGTSQPSIAGPNPGGTPTPTPHDGETDWKNAGGTDWNTGANWIPVTGNAPPAPADVAWFKGAQVSSPNVSASSAVSGLYFNGTNSSGYTVSASPSQTLTLIGSATSIGTETSPSTAVAIGAENTSGTNTISAPIILQPNSGTNSTIFQAAGGTLVMSSVISGSGISLTKTGGGILSLQTATNTYSGGTFINSGTVLIDQSGSLGTGAVTLGSSGGGDAALLTTNNTASPTNNITVASGSGGTLTLGSNSAAASAGSTFSGTITLNGDLSVTSSYAAGGALKLSGVISGSGALTKVGSGEADLTGASSNTYTGLTTVSAGTLGLGKSQGINAFGGDLTINGGTVYYSALNNNQIPDSAKVTISSGTLNFGAQSETIGQVATATSGLSMTNGSILMTSGTVKFANSLNVTGGSISVGSGVFETDTEFNFSGGSLDITGTGALNLRGGTGTGITYSASGTSTVQITNSGGNGSLSLNSASGATTIFNIADSPSVAVEMIIATPITGAGKTLQKSGAGVLELTGTNTYTGTTNISAGTLQLGGGGTTGSLSTGTSIVDNGTLIINRSNAVTQGTDFTSSAITGTGTFVQAGAGTTTLNAANSYNGTTTINAGTLQLDNNNTTTARLANTSNITVNSGGTLLLSQTGVASNDRINNSATMTLNGGTFNTGGLSEHGVSNNTAGIGALTLQSSSIINMGAGSSIVAFADSHLASWTGTLSIWNWSGTPTTGGGTDQLYFGNTSGGLTTSQLGEINIYSDNGTTLLGAAMILADGEIVPVPEPATWFAGTLAFSVLVYSVWRRRRALARA